MQLNVALRYTDFSRTNSEDDQPLKNQSGDWMSADDIMYEIKAKLPSIMGLMDNGDSLIISFSVVPAKKD